jgi:hypothetical protein
VNRLVCLLALCFAAALAGCKDPAPDSPGLASALVRPGSDIVVKAVRTYATADNVAYSSDEYYIVTLNFTNRLGYALAPRIDHFVLEDAKNVRYLGVDSGNANLAGIENYDGVLKVGENHDYTVGFRVPQNAQGILYYDASF